MTQFMISEELLGIISEPDLKRAVDVREVIGRFTDGSRFEEFKPYSAQQWYVGWTSIHGYTGWYTGK